MIGALHSRVKLIRQVQEKKEKGVSMKQTNVKRGYGVRGAVTVGTKRRLPNERELLHG
jgi:hypothetical protein